MSDLIDRQSAIEFRVSHGLNEDGRLYVPFDEVRKYLERLPSALSEVIRCKDCRYYDAHECKHPRALIFSEDDDFCSHAERRTDE